MKITSFCGFENVFRLLQKISSSIIFDDEVKSLFNLKFEEFVKEKTSLKSFSSNISGRIVSRKSSEQHAEKFVEFQTDFSFKRYNVIRKIYSAIEKTSSPVVD